MCKNSLLWIFGIFIAIQSFYCCYRDRLYRKRIEQLQQDLDKKIISIEVSFQEKDLK